MRKIAAILLACSMTAGLFSVEAPVKAAENVPEVTLRVCNWEEYIDLGDWDEEEVIDLDSGDIFGENSMVDDFEDWYLQEYGVKVNVEYSAFGSNEELYNMLTLGDEFDLVCPSEYMVMKLMTEKALVPFSKEFYDPEIEHNYYAKGLSPYIKNVFETQEIQGEKWNDYFAGYMWGLTGIVYDPEKVTAEDASTWGILSNPKYRRRITLKDNVRDSYFAAVGVLKSDLLTSDAFKNRPDYRQALEQEMNDVTPETIEKVQNYLQDVKNTNLYSFESDAGKADMVTGKVYANYQWSGDAVYTLDQADEDDFTLAYAVPEEATNIYFDGWAMLKKGIGDDEMKQHAAESFVNFLSRPDNVVRNMYYIGYTSVISGGEDSRVFEYADWCYGAEDDEEEVEEYPLGYFFTGDNADEDYIISAPADQVYRQLYAQYPDEETINRASIMTHFDEEDNAAINQMWINIRCFNLYDIPMWVWVLVVLVICGLLTLAYRKKKRKEYYE